MTPYPKNLLEFQRMFPSEGSCTRYMARVRWPDGFVCRYCGSRKAPFTFANRPLVVRCRRCRKDTSLTAGTVMHGTRTPLCTWFWSAYLATTQTPGMSALQLQRQLGIPRYETAFQVLHKLRAPMVRPGRDRIGAEYPVEVDETLVGGRTRGEGRGVHHKVYVVGAVEVRRRQKGEDRAAEGSEEHEGGVPLKRPVYAGRLRLRLLQSRGRSGLSRFVRESVEPGAVVLTDGWQGYAGLVGMGYQHQAVIIGDDPKQAEKHLPLIHLVFSNMKAWLYGTHHGVSQHHLQAYLNEYVFRFNRRFYPMTSFATLLGLGAIEKGPTYDGLYDGAWQHPNLAVGGGAP